MDLLCWQIVAAAAESDRYGDSEDDAKWEVAYDRLWDLLKEFAKTPSVWLDDELAERRKQVEASSKRKRRGRKPANLDSEAIQRVLKNGSSRREASRVLGIPHSTLDRWCNKKGLR